jgi:hypothetical protein
MMKHLDAGTVVVAIVTLALFVAALAFKGFTHDVLLEAGVFLISIKLILMVHNNGAMEERLDAKLDSVLELLKTPKH